MKLGGTLFSFLLLIITTLSTIHAKPSLGIVIVVDQMAYHLFEQLRPFFTGGLKSVTQEGVYACGFYPHARPATATGHAALSTGAHACKHGIIANEWYSPDGTYVKAFDDEGGRAQLLGRSTKKAKSCRHLMAEALADRFITTNSEQHYALSFSLKSRSAIPLAGFKGKAHWFDTSLGKFTSSKAYYETLPEWITHFNDTLHQNLSTQLKTNWTSVYPESHEAYKGCKDIVYQYSSVPFRLMNHPQPYMKDTTTRSKLFLITPEANKALLTLGKKGINACLEKNPEASCLCFLSLSSLDLVGHLYGPESFEYKDMLYHIDLHLASFIADIENKYKNTHTIHWIVTADHGIMPIPELTKQTSPFLPRRIDSPTLVTFLNERVEKEHGLKNSITGFEIPYFYLNPTLYNQLSNKQKKAVTQTLKKELQKQAGIKRVWDKKELFRKTSSFPAHTEYKEQWFGLQYYPGRSGDLICMVEPYTYLTRYEKGTSHCTPYWYDTHVPVIFKSPIIPEKKERIAPRLNMLHVTSIIAHVMNTDPPAHAFPIPTTLKAVLKKA